MTDSDMTPGYEQFGRAIGDSGAAQRHAEVLRGLAGELKRMRLPLKRHSSELLLVFDKFEEGGRYVAVEVPLSESESWNWLDWDNRYDMLADEWRRRYASQDAQ